MTSVKASMQIGVSQFSAEGSEEFVKSMLDTWIDLSKNVVTSNSNFSESLNQDNSSNSSSVKSNQGIEKFENVFDEIDGEVKIIAQMPGNNKAEKTRNTALALLYANHLNGKQSISADDIRDACQDQGCYDSSNFASHLKGLKDKVAMNKTKAGGGYDVKLTAPGRKAASSFVEQMNNESE
ncbi:hypothetical protein HKD42_06575 [Altererythrobacter sp. RZ02]|uniref:Uncharacterized protein n=1 Tax=Pontixanthobacter rizhaonensis TaxID=2730337 RepID=A0A848QLV4_9SPHN|nr:hypothetical protein [Pontixanthobacter rizhaonensis]NMW31720.1 hypothetical protein [Pontixanthobacter rizhaonensis]